MFDIGSTLVVNEIKFVSFENKSTIFLRFLILTIQAYFWYVCYPWIEHDSKIQWSTADMCVWPRCQVKISLTTSGPGLNSWKICAKRVYKTFTTLLALESFSTQLADLVSLSLWLKPADNRLIYRIGFRIDNYQISAVDFSLSFGKVKNWSQRQTHPVQC